MPLLEFRLKNYFSFQQGLELSFRLDKKCPEKISNGLPFSTVMCLKGANASGKTNILKGLNFIAEFISKSFNYAPQVKMPIEHFYGADEAPTILEVDFSIEDVEFRYNLELTKEEVLKEAVYRKQTRFKKIIERTQNNIIFTIDEFKDLKNIVLKSNSSLISTAKQYNLKCIDQIWAFFNSFYGNVYTYGLREGKPDIYNVSEVMNQNQKMFEFTKDFIKTCDVGISDILIQDYVNKEDGKKVYFPSFIHPHDNKLFAITQFDESSGTKCLYSFLGLYWIVLNYGGVLIMDEFDINLHPHILPKLINMFLDRDFNKFNSQIIFTTHNDNVMDSISKYRNFLVNKEDNVSFGYRLDEISDEIIRNDRKISPIYNNGSIGGVPKL